MYVIIATSSRLQLLRRTLNSLSKCNFPQDFQEIIVIENGEKVCDQNFLRPYIEKLPIRYIYMPEANKSKALNTAIDTISSGLIVFLDDDVRIHKDTLIAYSHIVGEMLSGRFYGGPVRVDYEKQPPAWLLRKLPASAKGWSLGEHDTIINKACFLGLNWAAFATDLQKVGGFNVTMGPGSASRGDGEETNMQRRLLQSGLQGIYVARAEVWHYVPQHRCTPEWTISKAKRLGVAAGIENRDNKSVEKRIRLIRAALIYSLSSVITELLDRNKIDKKVGFRWRIRKHYYHGFLLAGP
ncbi:MAG: glycosyltransferase [Deltaproteobacteria bacterium]|nr:glycosyltransferase [Deltaproteobacteria bacterium]